MYDVNTFFDENEKLVAGDSLKLLNLQKPGSSGSGGRTKNEIGVLDHFPSDSRVPFPHRVDEIFSLTSERLAGAPIDSKQLVAQKIETCTCCRLCYDKLGDIKTLGDKCSHEKVIPCKCGARCMAGHEWDYENPVKRNNSVIIYTSYSSSEFPVYDLRCSQFDCGCIKHFDGISHAIFFASLQVGMVIECVMDAVDDMVLKSATYTGIWFGFVERYKRGGFSSWTNSNTYNYYNLINSM